jgi:hypothetical protein
VEVEHQVQLTHVVEVVVQDFHEQVDALLQFGMADIKLSALHVHTQAAAGFGQ